MEVKMETKKKSRLRSLWDSIIELAVSSLIVLFLFVYLPSFFSSNSFEIYDELSVECDFFHDSITFSNPSTAMHTHFSLYYGVLSLKNIALGQEEHISFAGPEDLGTGAVILEHGPNNYEAKKVFFDSCEFEDWPVTEELLPDLRNCIEPKFKELPICKDYLQEKM